MSHTLASNYALEKQASNLRWKNNTNVKIQESGLPDSHIVNQTITMTDKVFSRPT
jgi:hypothetical protein